MSLKPLGIAERHGGVRQRAQLLWPAFDDRCALHEVENAQARGETRRARRRQYMVRSGDIIADRFRRVGADKDRAGVANTLGQPFSVGDDDLDMLRRERVDKRQRGVKVAR